MNVLLLTTHVNLGGVGIYVLSQAKGLTQRGHQVWVASSGGNLVPLLSSYGVEHLTLDIKTKSIISPKVFLACRRVAQIVKEKNIQVIHAHTRVTQVLAHLVSQNTGVPYVTTCHGFFKPRIFRKLFSCWGGHCIAISDAVREHLVNDFNVDKQKISVVHNGVEIEKFSPQKFSQQEKEGFKKDYGLKTGAPIIGTVARLSSVKGQQYLILAMQRIVEKIPQAQLLLVGDGPEKENLVAQVKELGIGNKVFFGASTFDTSVPLSIMDVFVLPSLMEGLGLAIIEAQAMGLPIVASDVGGIYSIVQDGITGLLVEAKDVQGLAEAILKLVTDKQLAQSLSQAGQRQARDKLNLRQMIDGIEQVYKDILKK
ncbi:MAG: glycosyltransferase family 4 protein [Candidatus Omnitrophica bacterium]|nr:glycosyltransferase family 4 protein [Candidatus Omnitrophota bacterium]